MRTLENRRKRGGGTAVAGRAVAAVEPLEGRRLLASVTLSGGVLVVSGDANASNSISVTLQPGSMLKATAGQSTSSFPVSQVRVMKITGGLQSDTVDISSSVKVGAYVDVGAGNDTVRTGGGNDTVVAGDGNDLVVNRGGVDAIYGQGGTNTVYAASSKDVVYAGRSGSRVYGATNLSWQNPNPTIPPPPPIPAPGPVPTPVTTVNPRSFGAKLDGVTDDSAAVQAALDSLPSTGGTLVLDGVAGIGAAGIHLNGKTGVSIAGTKAGAGFRALADSINAQQPLLGPAVLALVGCTNVSVHDVRIDGAGRAVGAIGMSGCSGTTVQRVEVTGAGGSAAVSSVGGNGNQYLNNNFHDLPNSCRGFWIGNNHAGDLETNPVISGNTITRIGGTGIGLTAHGPRVVNNSVTFAGGSGVALAGVSGQVTDGAYVANNYLCNNTFQGIQSDNWSTIGGYTQYTPIGSAVIENNVCDRNVHSGIYALMAQGWVIRNNECNDNSTGGFGYGAGITLSAVRQVQVTGNTCRDTHGSAAATQTDGISMVSAFSDQISDVTISGNTCSGNKEAGVLVVNDPASYTMRNIAVTGNTLTNNGQYGLYMREGTPGSVTGVTVSGNTLTGNGTANYQENLAALS